MNGKNCERRIAYGCMERKAHVLEPRTKPKTESNQSKPHQIKEVKGKWLCRTSYNRNEIFIENWNELFRTTFVQWMHAEAIDFNFQHLLQFLAEAHITPRQKKYQIHIFVIPSCSCLYHLQWIIFQCCHLELVSSDIQMPHIHFTVKLLFLDFEFVWALILQISC